MKMLIRIPYWLVRLWDQICDFAGVVLYDGMIRIMVADVLLVVLGIVFGGYYWITSGWQAALQTEALYFFGFAFVMCFIPRGG